MGVHPPSTINHPPKSFLPNLPPDIIRLSLQPHGFFPVGDGVQDIVVDEGGDFFSLGGGDGFLKPYNCINPFLYLVVVMDLQQAHGETGQILNFFITHGHFIKSFDHQVKFAGISLLYKNIDHGIEQFSFGGLFGKRICEFESFI